MLPILTVILTHSTDHNICNKDFASMFTLEMGKLCEKYEVELFARCFPRSNKICFSTSSRFNI